MAGTEPTLAAFAKQQRLRTRRDSDGTAIVQGKLGHIFEYDNQRLAVLVVPDPPRRQYWGYAKQKLVAAGFEVVQDADGEGSATFDPSHRLQAELAIRVVTAKRRRTPSPKQLLAAHRALASAQAARKSIKSPRTRHPAAQDAPQALAPCVDCPWTEVIT